MRLSLGGAVATGAALSVPVAVDVVVVLEHSDSSVVGGVSVTSIQEL